MPQFDSIKPDGTVDYKVHMPTCCFGTCVNVCAAGCCNCRIPFHIYPHHVDSTQAGAETGSITRIWTGFGNLLIGVSKFEVVFPTEADVEAKARLLGGLFLINEVFFRNPENGDNSN